MTSHHDLQRWDTGRRGRGLRAEDPLLGLDRGRVVGQQADPEWPRSIKICAALAEAPTSSGAILTTVRSGSRQLINRVGSGPALPVPKLGQIRRHNDHGVDLTIQQTGHRQRFVHPSSLVSMIISR
jgi:hypothetical protein